MHLRHPLVTAVALLLGLLLALGAIGSLTGEGRKSTSSEKVPADVPTSEQPSTRSPAATATQTPAERRGASQPATDGVAKGPDRKPPVVKVLRIIDGDTIDVRGDGRIVPKGDVVRVRLLEIDTPERGDCFAGAATARTKALLPLGSSARIERDADLTDRYDRYLLYVWNAKGVFVNESLVRSGHAEAVLYPPNDKHWPKISRAEDTARRTGAGLWTACAADTPQPVAPDTPEPAAPDAANPGLPAGPPAGVPDVDCSDLSGPVWVGANDPHRLDRDGDGVGCDSN